MIGNRNIAVTWKDQASYLLAALLLAVPILTTVFEPSIGNREPFASLSAAVGDWLTAAAATFLVLLLIYRRRSALVTQGGPENEHAFETLAVFSAYFAAMLLPDRQDSSYWAMLLLSATSVGLAASHIYTWSVLEESVGTGTATFAATIFAAGCLLAIGGLALASIARSFGYPYNLCAGAVGLIGVLLSFVCVPVLIMVSRAWRYFMERRRRPSEEATESDL